MFKETFSVITASGDTLLEVMKVTVNKNKTNKISRITLIAAAVILTFGMMTVAMAYVGFTQYENPLVMLRAFFGDNGTAASEGIVEYNEDGQLEMNLPGWERVPVDEDLASDLVTDYISGETATASWEGYTLTVEAYLYDALTQSALIYYTVENPDGASGYGIDVNSQFGWIPKEGNVFTRINLAGETYIDEAMSTDTKLYICEYIIIWEFADDPSTVEIEVGVQAVDPEPYYEGAVIGDVHERIKIQLSDGGGMSGLVLRDGNILVSPISIRIFEEALGFDPAGYIHNIILRYKDGSEYVLLDNDGFLDNRMYALGQGSEGLYHTTHLFNRLVDIDNLSEIVLDNLIIKVD